MPRLQSVIRQAQYPLHELALELKGPPLSSSMTYWESPLVNLI